MHSTEMEQVEVEALEELFGPEIEEQALEQLGEHDHTDDPQAIGSVIWTVRVRC